MPDIQVIQPTELSATDFVFKDDKWNLARPYLDGQADNALDVGAEGGLVLPESKLKRYRIIPDGAESRLNFYEYYGDVFDQATATLLDSVDIATISVEVDDFEINDTVILFKDVQSGKQITFDTALPIYEVLYRNSTSMQIQGNGKNSELVVDLIVDPDIGNLLKVTASGVIVSSDDIISIFNRKIDESLGIQNDVDNSVLKVTLGEAEKTVGTSRLVNSAGVVLGYVLT